MRRRLGILIVATAAAITLMTPAAANATNQAGRFWQTTSSPAWGLGTRVSVGNPTGSERTISSGDFFDTAAYADDGASGDDLLQQGVTYEYNDPENSCNLGDSGSPALYYFTEKQSAGTYTCYSGGTATGGEAQLLFAEVCPLRARVRAQREPSGIAQ